MAALDFPSAPTVGQYFVAGNGVTYQWNGTMWLPTGGTGALFIGLTPPSNPGAGQLWFNSEQARLYVYYNDGNSQQWVPSAPIPGPTPPPSAGATRVKFTKYLASGSWTPDPLMLYGQATAKGGGGNSGTITVSPTYIQAGGGGGEGGTAIKYFNAGDYIGAQAVTVGAAQANSSIGAWLIAPGGGTSQTWSGGWGGSGGTGDLLIPGAAGESGIYSPGADAVALSGSGGGAGGGPGQVMGSVGAVVAGVAGIANSGGGGGGGSSRNAGPGTVPGGAGATGIVTVTEYLRPA